jgi:very-short-patch-repair endonuclease
MAPYAIAHLKLGRLLKETGYQFLTDQRLGIYLTNTLEEAVKHTETMFAEWITEEANAAAEIKKEKPIMVVLGNPPYSGHSANKGKWAKELVQRYYQVDGAPLGEKNPKWLQDDYVKFLAFGQWRIEQTKHGILGFITNHSYLDNPTFRGMRQSLMNTFTDIYILNLHGNSKKKEVAPDGGKDENVFDIQQGVTIGIFAKDPGKTGPATVYYADLWGLREGKYHTLLESSVAATDWVKIKPSSPFYLFVPLQEDLLAEYKNGWKVTDIFPVNGVGMTTARDHVVIDSEPQPLLERATVFKESEDSNAVLCEKLNISQKLGWNITRARQLVQQEENLEQYIKPVLYRPFDARLIFYHDSLVWRTVKQIMRHILAGENLGLISARSNKSPEMNHFFCSRFIMETKCGESTTQSCLFPLYLYPTEKKEQQDKSGGKEGGIIEPLKLQEKREPNLNPKFIAEIERRLGIPYQPHPQSPSPSTERGLERGVVESRWRTEPQLWEKLKPMARQMRKEPTEAEELLWQCLRNRQLLGFKFRRQHSVERFIVDFYCAEAGLVIEVDGPVHQYQKEEDFIRQTFIESQGLRLLRFSNEDVLNKLDTVIQQIINALPHPHPSPSTERELEREVASTERGLGGEVLTPEDIFNYAYAVFHSPTYRTRYEEFLKIDFPRLPLTSSKELFKKLAEKGAELVSLHLMESPLLNTLTTKYPVTGDHQVGKVSYDEKTQRVYINKTQYFEGVPPEVWNFHIGGYQVCEKWLKDRQKAHRKLSGDDVNHYQKNYSSCLPSNALVSVASSAYSSSVPKGRPRASLVTLIPSGASSWLRYIAVCSPSRFVLVAKMTSRTAPLFMRIVSSRMRTSLAPTPSVGEIAPCST